MGNYADETQQQKDHDEYQRGLQGTATGSMHNQMGLDDKKKGGGGGGGGSCWIATAYYGDPQHESVISLRAGRELLMKHRYLGGFVRAANTLYHKVGRTKFGSMWAAELSRPIPNPTVLWLSLAFLKINHVLKKFLRKTRKLKYTTNLI